MIQMGDIKNITVTDSRVRHALSNVLQHSTPKGNGVSSETLTDNGVTCDLLEATVKKWFVGIDKIIISINNEEVEAFINYPFMNTDYIISVVPEGKLVENSSEGAYIIPATETIANVLKYGDKYCVLGFKRGNSTKCSDVGEILLQAGDNKVIISKEYISIHTNALFINGVRKEVEP